MLQRSIDLGTSFVATLARGALGLSVGPIGPRPEKPLELYEFEGCPYCRKVREALSILDLEAWIRPCPKGGQRFRPEIVRRGGKALFPYLVDPNTGIEMYESDDIVSYLFGKYGDGPVPLGLRLGLAGDLSSSFVSAIRFTKGISRIPSREPEKPLELWSFEPSPFSRLAREALSSLELPYLLHNVAKGSPSRRAFAKRSGKMMVPFLEDPNTGRSMFESADIVSYLMETYALPAGA